MTKPRNPIAPQLRAGTNQPKVLPDGKRKAQHRQRVTLDELFDNPKGWLK